MDNLRKRPIIWPSRRVLSSYAGGKGSPIDNEVTADSDRQLYADIAGTCACLNFRKATRAVTQLFDDHLEPSGLRSTQFVLLVAIGIFGPTSVARLSRELVMDASTLARNLRPLEKSELVHRAQSGGARGRQITLSEKGKALVDQTIPLWKEAQTQFLSRFGADGWSQALDILNRAVGATRA